MTRGYEEECEVPSDIKELLALCAANKWLIKTSDVKSAFLQGIQLDRLVTMKPPKEAGLPKDASLQFYIKCTSAWLNQD